MSSDPVAATIMRTFAEERADALDVLDRAIAGETRALLADVYRATRVLVARHGAPPGTGNVAAAVLTLAAHDHPPPPAPGVDPYGTERMSFEDGPP